MNIFKRVVCQFKQHIWLNKTRFPVHGWHDTPYAGSYCGRCGKVAG